MNLTSQLTRESKIKLFTHNDLDGIGCELLGRLAFENIDVTIVKHPKDASEKVSEFVTEGLYENYDKVFITDISVDMETALKIDDLPNIHDIMKFALLDHHGTADELNVFPWASVKVYQGATPRSGKESGTNMFFEYLVMNGFFVKENYRDAITIFVEKIRRYDTWEWKEKYDDQDSMMLNQLIWLLGAERFVLGFLEKFASQRPFIVSEGSWLQMFSKGDLIIIDTDKRNKEAYINRKEKQMVNGVDKFGNKFGIVFSEQYTSELGNVLSERHPEFKYIAMIDMGSQKVSLRTTHDDIDLGKDIAKLYGGGGHAKASGFEFDQDLAKLSSLVVFSRNRKLVDRVFDMVLGTGIIGKITKVIDKLSNK